MLVFSASFANHSIYPEKPLPFPKTKGNSLKATNSCVLLVHHNGRFSFYLGILQSVYTKAKSWCFVNVYMAIWVT